MFGLSIMSEQNFFDALAETVELKKKRRPRSTHHVNFLAAKKDIEAAINAGFALHTIFETLVRQKRIDCKYSHFTTLVKKFDLQPAAKPEAKKTTSRASKQALGHEEVKPKTSEQPRTFHFNPVPDKSKLI